MLLSCRQIFGAKFVTAIFTQNSTWNIFILFPLNMEQGGYCANEIVIRSLFDHLLKKATEYEIYSRGLKDDRDIYNYICHKINKLRKANPDDPLKGLYNTIRTSPRKRKITTRLGRPPKKMRIQEPEQMDNEEKNKEEEEEDTQLIAENENEK